jgi:hypothetical protein
MLKLITQSASNVHFNAPNAQIKILALNANMGITLVTHLVCLYAKLGNSSILENLYKTHILYSSFLSTSNKCEQC